MVMKMVLESMTNLSDEKIMGESKTRIGNKPNTSQQKTNQIKSGQWLGRVTHDRGQGESNVRQR
jgi:hypothetical protein